MRALPAPGLSSLRARYVLSMVSLCLLDLALTAAYVLISARIEVLLELLLANVLVLGVLNALVAGWIYAPIQALEVAPDGGEALRAAARRRLERLPALSTAWALAISALYGLAVFASGTFMPSPEDTAAVPFGLRAFAVGWFVLLFALYGGSYVYFVANDFAEQARRTLFERLALAIEPKPGGYRRKITVAMLVFALLPNVHLLLDLTVLRPVREAQGLDVTGTVLLDLLATTAVILLSLRFVARAIVRPIHALAQAVQRVGGGDLDTRTAPISNDEVGLLTVAFNRMVEGMRERAFIRETFGRYVPESVVAAIIEGKAPLRPLHAESTILFADIENFTGTCESMSPDQVVAMLNAYYSAVIEPIERHRGIVNQIQGDALLVTFNVPVADPEHARHAVDAALAMLDVVATSRFAGVALQIRIGINTGSVVAGNVGSSARHSYTVHGDAVNIAARLEQMNKGMGTRLLVSETTIAKLGSSAGFAPLGEVAVRGKLAPVRVYGPVP